MVGCRYWPRRSYLGSYGRHVEYQYFVYFDDINVSKGNILGKIDGGINVRFEVLNPERMVVAAQAIGSERHALQRGADYVNEIYSGSHRPYRYLQNPTAESKALLKSASLMIQKAAWLQDSGEHSKVVSDCANTGDMVDTDTAF